MNLEDVDFAVVKILATRPTHGYDIFKQLADTGIAGSRSFLYKKLKALKRRGLINDEVEDSGRGYPKSTWELTPAGQEAHYQCVVSELRVSEAVMSERVAVGLRNFVFQDTSRFSIVPQKKRMLLDYRVGVNEKTFSLINLFFETAVRDNEIHVRFSDRLDENVIGNLLDSIHVFEKEEGHQFDIMALVGRGFLDEIDEWLRDCERMLSSSGGAIAMLYTDRFRPNPGPYDQVAVTFDDTFRHRFETEFQLDATRPVASNQDITRELVSRGFVDVSTHVVPFFDILVGRLPGK